MTTPETLAAQLARCVQLFRNPDAKQAQKAEFRALLGLLKDEAVVLKDSDGQLLVNGVAVRGNFGSLIQRMGLHNVSEITIQRHAAPSQVFELVTAIADQPALGRDDIPSRLRNAGVDQVTVAIAELTPLASPTGDAPPAAPEAAGLLGQLERYAQAPNVGGLLDAAFRHVQSAFKADELELMLSLLAGVARILRQLPRGSNARHYGGVFKRVCTRAVLERLVGLISAPKCRDDVILVLRQAGAVGVKVLIDLLVAAPTMSERRVLFDVLGQMEEGTDELVHMLAHRQWFVVRNGAELAGVLGLEQAVPALAQQLDHKDERVRKAVALALAKIGSGGTAEALRRALRDKSAEVRIQVALGVGGRRSSALAMPLVVALQEEKDETVQRELLLALGRIGTADAVQALIQVVQPTGRLFGRKPVALRVAAVEALRIAATPVAAGILEGLAGDPDRQVSAAAQDALEDLKRRKT
jgi:hypothetical protein